MAECFETWPRELRQVARNRWTGQRTLILANTDVERYSRGMWNTVYPRFSGGYAPRVKATRCIFNYRDYGGIAALELHYETERPPKQARVRFQRARFAAAAALEWERVVYDLDGKRVSGPAGDGRNDWEVVEGANGPDGSVIRPVAYRAPFSIDTAYFANEFNLGDTMGMIGTVNDATLSKVGNAAKETVLLVGVAIDNVWGSNQLNIDYDFIWDKRGWNNSIKSQMGTWFPEKKPAFEYSTSTKEFTVLSTTRYVLTYWPGYENYLDGTTWKFRAAPSESRRVFETSSFSKLNAMVVW